MLMHMYAFTLSQTRTMESLRVLLKYITFAYMLLLFAPAYAIIYECFVSGPLVALLCNKFGLRAVTITGGVVSFVGMVMSSFPPSLSFLAFSYGIVTGM